MRNQTEGSREYFKGTIDMLKEIAMEQGVILPDEEIARSLNISPGQFRQYYSDAVEAPAALFTLLREKYPQFIAGRSVQQIWVSHEVDVEDPETPPLDTEEEV